MKMVPSQPVTGPGSISREAWGKARSAACWWPQSVLFPQQGSCRLLLHDGHGATHRAGNPHGLRQGLGEARKPFGQIPPCISAVPEKTLPHPAFLQMPSRWRCDKELNPINPKAGQIRGGKKKNHILRTAHQGSPYPQNRGLRDKSPAAQPLCRTTVAVPTPRAAAPAAGVGVEARGQCGGKMSAHCCRMSSTTWFWNTMVMGMLVSSVSGRSSVGPNTMATLCTDMRFCSPCSITLQRGKGWAGGWTQGPGLGGGGGVGAARPVFPFPQGSPAHRQRCWMSSRSVSWLGAGSERTRSRTQRLR